MVHGKGERTVILNPKLNTIFVPTHVCMIPLMLLLDDCMYSFLCKERPSDWMLLEKDCLARLVLGLSRGMREWIVATTRHTRTYPDPFWRPTLVCESITLCLLKAFCVPNERERKKSTVERNFASAVALYRLCPSRKSPSSLGSYPTWRPPHHHLCPALSIYFISYHSLSFQVPIL